LYSPLFHLVSQLPSMDPLNEPTRMRYSEMIFSGAHETWNSRAGKCSPEQLQFTSIPLEDLVFDRFMDQEHSLWPNYSNSEISFPGQSPACAENYLAPALITSPENPEMDTIQLASTTQYTPDFVFTMEHDILGVYSNLTESHQGTLDPLDT